MLQRETYYAIGLMSGSSLDGLDICYVRFQTSDMKFKYEILQTDCIEYDNDFRKRLQDAPHLTAFEFAKLHTEIGRYFGKLTNDFILKNKIENLDFITSHGQTIFHQPIVGFTTQIGCGAQIAAQTNCKVISDLRTTDVAYGGQGAPIVPIAESYLFPDYNVFLNIGGIANIAFHNPKSLKEPSEITAYDVCAGNTLLNHFAKEKGMEYDKNGNLARSGHINYGLLKRLNAIDFCQHSAPKSLGSEHIFDNWIPLFDKHEISTEDKLATAVEHIAMMVGQALKSQIPNLKSQILITGGGAFNSFLIERIQHHTKLKAVVPDNLSVQHKEALAMAFIGLLRVMEIPNCLASVTGAKKNTVGGAVYLP